MTEIFITANTDVYEKVKKLLSTRLNKTVEILKTPEGKPYIGGNEVFFSISHSKDVAVIAISDKPVGIDFEFVKDGGYFRVLSSFTDEERAKIKNSGDFFKVWTAKEAFIKMKGGTLAHDLKKTVFLNGKIFYDGVKQDVILKFKKLKNGGVCAICGGLCPLSRVKIKYLDYSER